MTPPSGPAPAAPAASPPPAPTPPPTPAPAAAPPPSSPGPDLPQGGEPNPFAEIDAAWARVEGTPAPGAPPAAPAAPAQPAGEPAKPAATPAAAKPPGAVQPAPELRKEYDRLKGEHAALSTKAAELERKIAEAESRGKDTEALKARLTQVEKERDDLRGELRTARQEVSPEFKEKFDKPYDEAAEYARYEVQQLTVTDLRTSEQRPATFEDFVNLYKMPSAERAAAIEAMFGPAAGLVNGHITTLKQLEFKRSRALEEERKNAAERAKADEGARLHQMEQVNAAWNKVNSDISQKVEGYHDSPDDAESAALRQKGYQIFDSQPATLRERIVRDAHIRQRAAAFSPLMLQNQRLKARVAELEAQVGGKTKIPNPTRHPSGGAEGGGAPNETWEQQARRELGE